MPDPARLTDTEPRYRSRGMWGSIVAVAALAATLSACAVATQKLDALTGTTKAERCVDYRAALAASALLPRTTERIDREAVYRAFIGTNCPAVPPE